MKNNSITVFGAEPTFSIIYPTNKRSKNFISLRHSSSAIPIISYSYVRLLHFVCSILVAPIPLITFSDNFKIQCFPLLAKNRFYSSSGPLAGNCNFKDRFIEQLYISDDAFHLMQIVHLRMHFYHLNWISCRMGLLSLVFC